MTERDSDLSGWFENFLDGVKTVQVSPHDLNMDSFKTVQIYQDDIKTFHMV